MKFACFYLCLLLSFSISAQNLPSLLTGRNINATFAIVGYDSVAQEWGVAVATHNIYVGNSTIYIEAGLGAFAVIAETEPDYGLHGLAQLRTGKSVQEAIEFTKTKDESSHYRQVAGIDAQGNTYAFTGEALKFWRGKSDHQYGQNFVVLGNQLDEQVLSRMSQTFQSQAGTLAERLLAALLAGQQAGGQVTGKQSAALMVKGSQNNWYNQIDLRVDNSRQPFQDLQTLLDHHYGRIRLNQAGYAWRAGNSARANQKLKEAEQLLEGWEGMYGRIAQVHAMMGDTEQAAAWIVKALEENPQWVVQLPAFYFLKEEKVMAGLIKEDQFSTKDWEAALSMLLRMDADEEALQLALKLLEQKETSSYLLYLIGKSFAFNGENAKAKSYIKQALKMDPKNVEAQSYLQRLP